MNPQIRELIEKATTVRYSGLGEIEEFDREKFAELLIRKCANIAGMNDDDTLSEGDIRARSIKRQIKEHFGVK